jgi:hypothetical protein
MPIRIDDRDGCRLGAHGVDDQNSMSSNRALLQHILQNNL